MNVSVLIPFAGTDPHRLAALTHVQARYEALGWQICVGSTPGPWCKAKAVTAALSAASGDVLVVADADCISAGTPAAVQAVTEGAPWSMPHKRVNRLTETSTQLVLAGAAPTVELGLTQPPYIGTPAGGIVALTRQAWQLVPIDPRFTGWGQEDESWGFALTALLGPPTRLRHDLWHLWHPPQPRLSRRIGSEAGKQLEARYRAARRDPPAMRHLIEEGRAATTRP